MFFFCIFDILVLGRSIFFFSKSMKAVSPIAGVSLYTPGQINPYDYTVVFLGDYRFTEYREGKGSHS